MDRPCRSYALRLRLLGGQCDETARTGGTKRPVQSTPALAFAPPAEPVPGNSLKDRSRCRIDQPPRNVLKRMLALLRDALMEAGDRLPPPGGPFGGRIGMFRGAPHASVAHEFLQCGKSLRMLFEAARTPVDSSIIHDRDALPISLVNAAWLRSAGCHDRSDSCAACPSNRVVPEVRRVHLWCCVGDPV